MILGAVIGAVVALIICFVIFYPKTIQRVYLDDEIEQKNKLVQQQLDEMHKELSILVQQKEVVGQELREAVEKAAEMQTQAENSAQSYYNHYMDLAKDRFNTDLELAETQYNDAIQNFEQEYLTLIEDSANEFSQKLQEKQNELQLAQKDLDIIYSDLNSKKEEINNINESLKLLKAEKEQQDFYKIKLSSRDIEEINLLREIIPHLRDGEPVNKIIWKSYYEKPFNDLIGRVVGSGKHCGIYKITNCEDGMAYVGQSVDIIERWRTHVKSGLGIAASNNKLYTAMQSVGVENFTFEILEECPRVALNDREKTWISNFNTNSYGYNMTAGGSRE